MYTYSKFHHAHLLFHFWRLFSRWASQKSPPPIVKNPPRKKKKTAENSTWIIPWIFVAKSMGPKGCPTVDPAG